MPAAVVSEPARRVVCVRGTNESCWVRECAVVSVHDYLGQQGRHLAIPRLVTQGPFDEITEPALCQGSEHIKGVRGRFVRSVLRSGEQVE